MHEMLSAFEASCNGVVVIPGGLLVTVFLAESVVVTLSGIFAECLNELHPRTASSSFESPLLEAKLAASRPSELMKCGSAPAAMRITARSLFLTSIRGVSLLLFLVFIFREPPFPLRSQRKDTKET